MFNLGVGRGGNGGVRGRKSQNTIKSLYISQLLTSVFPLTQERLRIVGGCDSVVQIRVCFLFSDV